MSIGRAVGNSAHTGDTPHPESPQADPPDPESPLPDSPGQRIRLLIARFLGLGFVAYFVVSISGFAEGAQLLESWWTPVAVFLVFAPGVALFVVTFAAPTRIAVAAAAAAIGIPLASALWFFAWNGGQLDGAARGTWLSALAGLAGLCAALVWRPLVAILIQLVATSSAAAVDQYGLFGPDASVLDIIYAAVWAFGFTTLLAVAVIMALRTGAILDATTSNHEYAAADAAASQAREQERVRFDSLIHDRVLATLLATARPDTGGRFSSDAKFVLAELDRAAEHPERSGTVSANLFAEQLAALVHRTNDPDNVVVFIDIDIAASEYPIAVASAIVGAAGEALRNSLRHANPEAERSLMIDLRPDAVRVLVTDTGGGFDTEAVGSGHLGIEVSIVRRMAELDGGSSKIDSGKGAGTKVLLEWSKVE
ncbi:ATP-binding protein [Rhodococcus sp. G-MC3]|uniref:sensor histidine kinase n=1 Tax=Rhodococcus sp. G-MC3 TaxID=3046209 RepID=UPI0024B9340C|nr:ATP-binding protein [Rhodococcus sp. G-MC3]MDJ0393608.1 ATP-binding protein [Rhodococcus sp. G-MC3]